MIHSFPETTKRLSVVYKSTRYRVTTFSIYITTSTVHHTWDATLKLVLHHTVSLSIGPVMSSITGHVVDPFRTPQFRENGVTLSESTVKSLLVNPWISPYLAENTRQTIYSQSNLIRSLVAICLHLRDIFGNCINWLRVQNNYIRIKKLENMISFQKALVYFSIG